MKNETICKARSYFPSKEEVEKVAEELVQEDQSIKADAGKLPITLVPREIVRNIAAVRRFGKMKYGSAENWKQVSKERYRDALCRHLLAYLDDPEAKDEESGLPALWHIATNVAFLCELEKENSKQ